MIVRLVQLAMNCEIPVAELWLVPYEVLYSVDFRRKLQCVNSLYRKAFGPANGVGG
jgi:hypothetical protein